MISSEDKMQIVINNYFKSECDINTSIRSAFEKGFRIGVKKAKSARPELKKGKWIDKSGGIECAWNYCSVCGEQAIDLYDFCPHCGADMRGEPDE
jgi:hypothetical protein